MSNSLGDTYEDFVAKRQEWWESDEATPRVKIAGFWYESGSPLTDEVIATQEYIRRKSLGLMDESGYN